MIEIYKSAENLPAAWDLLAGSNAALKKDNLRLLERTNPCRQQYVVFKEDEAYGILVHYALNIDIFSFSKLHFSLPVTIVGIPCSVAEPGYRFAGEERDDIRSYLSSLKGAKLVLNAGEDLGFLGFSRGYTLPNCLMALRWCLFEDYLRDLRSHYRYRYKKALKKMEHLTIEVLQNRFEATDASDGTETGAGMSGPFGFDRRHYFLYEQVYKRSEYKLEKLPIEFFKQSPAIITVFKLGAEPVAFVQYFIADQRLVFLFGGLDYTLNKQYDLYQNMLLYLVRKAIESGCSSISLGQTAEEMKYRLGASQELKYLYMHHSNKAINWLVNKCSGMFSYKKANVRLQVFVGHKEDGPC